MKQLFQITVLLCFYLPGRAQLTEKIETDRPDQTETSFIVPRHYFQAEFGFNTEAYHNGISQLVHPTSLLKYGLNKRMELRLESHFLSREEMLIPQPKTSTVLEPVEIGTKVILFEEKGWRPKTSVIVHAGLPFIAAKQYHGDPVNVSVRIAAQNTLTEAVALGYNLGVETGDETSFFYTFSPGVGIGKKWYGYIEAFGSFYNGSSENNMDGGIAYFTSRNTKLDLSAGFGLGNSLLKHYVALGFSFRIPAGRH